MPVIATKKNQINSGYPITLYGEKTELSQELFNKFPLNLDCGDTDIISIRNRILMMIRDRGHALTIDIDINNIDKENDILIKYFIPKLCNIEMIKRLPGINKISSDNAVGMFVSERKDVSEKIFNFIEKVPTDFDIPYFHKPIQENTYLFNVEDVQQIAMEKSEEGIRVRRIQELEKEIKRDIDKDKEEDELKEPNQNRVGEEYDGATKD